MKDKDEVMRGLLDLMENAFATMKQLCPEANQLLMFATEDGACVQGFRESPSWARSQFVDGYKSPKGDYQIRDFSR